eukprot:Anaeramoba_ignava/a481580_18.p1 GENE.a481580_18~~a481580_18.p1  ORF type:complete len:219 (-),score=99.01 a481580_18:26-682(-)
MWENSKNQNPRRKNKLNRYKRKKIPSIILPHNGTSINPDPESRSELEKIWKDYQVKKEKEKQMNLNFGSNFNSKFDLNSDSKKDSKTLFHIKNNFIWEITDISEQNTPNQLQKKITEKPKNQKDILNQEIDNLDQIKKEIQQENEEIKKRRKARYQRLKNRELYEPPKYFTEIPEPFLNENEVSGRFIDLELKRNLFQDRFLSYQRRSLLPVTKKREN